MKRKVVFFYEKKMAPFIAAYLFFLYYPLYYFCKKKRICFVVNIAGGVGHIICELDYFFRKQALEELDKRFYVWIRKKDPFSKTCIEFYGKKFAWARSSPLLFYLLLPLLIRFKEITYDGGLSRLKWQLPSKGQKKFTLPEQTFLYQIEKGEHFKKYKDYYRCFQKTKGYFPLKIKNTNSVRDWLGKDEKIALFQLKDKKKNASPTGTDPETYLPVIQYLKENGYTLVFSGREKMPKQFEACGVINYAESPFATFQHDIELYSIADLSINSGSGVAYLAECFDRPNLYINSWHLSMPLPSSKCIMVPALVQRKNGSFLSYKEQIDLYKSLPDQGEESFPEDQYLARNASQDEILEACKELLIIAGKPFSESQRKFNLLECDSPLVYSEARVSHYFLNKHKALE